MYLIPCVMSEPLKECCLLVFKQYSGEGRYPQWRQSIELVLPLLPQACRGSGGFLKSKMRNRQVLQAQELQQWLPKVGRNGQ